MGKENLTLKLLNVGGNLRARDFARAGISSVKIPKSKKSGELLKLGRGLYVSSNIKPTSQDHLAEIAIKYPSSVFCLLTALQIYGITTQALHEVLLAIDNKAREPSIDYRLSVSEHRNNFLLKGALLFDLWFDVPFRPARDTDLLGFGLAEIPHLMKVFQDFCEIKVDEGLL